MFLKTEYVYSPAAPSVPRAGYLSEREPGSPPCRLAYRAQAYVWFTIIFPLIIIKGSGAEP